jgi:hypothetical protein
MFLRNVGLYVRVHTASTLNDIDVLNTVIIQGSEMFAQSNVNYY